MSTTLRPSLVSLAAIIVVAGSVCVLGSCAGSHPAGGPTMGQTLLSAGFRVRTPETPKQKEIYATLPDQRVQKLTYAGRTYYVYKDAAKGGALVGGEAEYERYRQMRRDDRMLSGTDTAMEMEEASARRWSNAYGFGDDVR
jgi:hypothetical protein